MCGIRALVHTFICFMQRSTMYSVEYTKHIINYFQNLNDFVRLEKCDYQQYFNCTTIREIKLAYFKGYDTEVGR